MKHIALAACLLVPALAAADTPAAPVTPQELTFKLTVTDGTETRGFSLIVVADACGMVEEHQGDRMDDIKLCAKRTPQGLRIETHWRLHTKTLEHTVDFAAAVAKGKTIEVGRTNGAWFTLTMT